MFSQACVILFTGEGCLPQCMLGCHTPLGSRHPPRSRHPPEQTPPGGRHTLLEADTPWKQTPPRSRHPPEQTPPPGGRHPPGRRHPPRSRHPPWRQTPPGSDPPEQTPPPPGADTSPPPQSMLGCNLVVFRFQQVITCRGINHWTGPSRVYNTC